MREESYSLDGETFYPGGLTEAIQENELEIGDTVFIGRSVVPTGKDLVSKWALERFLEEIAEANCDDWFLEDWPPTLTEELHAEFREMLITWFDKHVADSLPSTITDVTETKVTAEAHAEATND